jgi:prepilin-type N-terminal cleavage/methylation domain-containing protein
MKPMNEPVTFRTPHSTFRTRSAFTLVEMLVVIAIIGILAGLLLPALAGAKKAAKIAKAKTEISGIVAAVQQYDTTYSRLPASPGAVGAANPDFTFGTVTNGILMTSGTTPGAPLPTITTENASTPYTAANSEVMAILLDNTNFVGSSTTGPINANHAKNPQQIIFLNAKSSGDNISPGIGNDLVFRDPWGNPYIISMDLNYDGKTRDGYYGRAEMSQPVTGFSGDGLTASGGPTTDTYEASVPVMVWSLGPDGQAGYHDPIGGGAVKANASVNKDNITSW